ncbi:uncharacterized protein LOC122512348 isoform X2 [Leptopilina heterotoma]|uniref:uncharacterized protein LOC122512348 isoform X2 n=1 Tax=Leptopilina heterotoma TaxID=63436 RepID=UPI001CAA01E7|nr:uncharacterized protein LOC122512348 isoform X2 [Leptopilina heterotoma]
MEAAAKSKEVADEYISSLADLSVNSKPLITMLTMLAEESIEHAPAIVGAVEAHLQKVRSDCKLPVLYLIDSIVKNVKGNYLGLFSHNIVNTFSNVFEEVDEATRASMFKLRQTWYNVFPAKKLYLLDVRVNAVDPAWPIRPLPASISGSSIHVNPRFFSVPRQNSSTPSTTPISSTNLQSSNNTLTSEAAMREQLLKKERELLELQKKKIELELLQAKASLEQQQRQLYKQVVNMKTDQTVMPTPPASSAESNLSSEKSNSPSQAPNKSKQFPTATATLLKKASAASNGPRIAPASSIAVASAKPVSRDPRLKVPPVEADQQNVPQVDPRLRPGNSSEAEVCGEEKPQAPIPTVLSEQLKQQMILKQAVTSTDKKPPLSLDDDDDDDSSISNLIVSSNNNANANLNNNNKNSSGNANKDAVVSHRKSQKKEPRSSSNSNNSIVSSLKVIQNQSVNNSSSSSSSCSASTASIRGGESNSKSSKDSKSPSKRSSLTLSDSASSFASSKSSHRKLGSKSRSKQPHSSPSKIQKIDNRDQSPVRSKSREKENEDNSSSSSRASPQSSSQSSSKSRKKTSSKSRKRSPSPYRIPRRNDIIKSTGILNNSIGGLNEEEQSSGSLIVSPPHPPTFKEIRPAARQRNYMRRNKDGSLSPEPSVTSPTTSNQQQQQPLSESLLDASTKDEDLRGSLLIPVATTTSSLAEKKEDLDLRVLPPVSANKRQSSEHEEPTVTKKSKLEKFDALFGNEDVDLRMLTNPNAGRPPTPPPPVISGEEGKDSWAKLKTPSKSNDRDKSEKTSSDEKRDRDRVRDPLGRPRLYNKLPEDPKERRRLLSNEDQDPRFTRRGRDTDKHERNSDRNIEIILKQAAEQLSQGAISKADYNKLIQEVLHMTEMQKLKVAQRQDKEVGSMVWEKGSSMDMKNRMGNFPMKDGDHHRKEYPMGRNDGPRWQQPWQRPPWGHPPGPPFGGQNHFNPDFRIKGPWQNARHFGPMRPDFNQFHGNFNPNMGPRMGPGMMGHMGPNGPIMPNMMGPMGMGNTPLPMPGMGSMMMNGPLGKIMHPVPAIAPPVQNSSSPTSTPKYEQEEPEGETNGPVNKNSSFNCELPTPDQKLLDEISNDVMRSIKIDNVEREIRYYDQTAVVFLSWDDPREIGFQDGVRRVLIDGKETITCAFNEPYKEFRYKDKVHRIKLGGPTRELYVDDRWYECYFGGPPISINLDGKIVSVKLEGPSPQVKIGTSKRTDLVVGKINLIINAKDMVPLFLDAKPQNIKIEGKSHTLEFIDSLKTALLNGQPFKVEFGDLPKPIIVGGKKHFIRFSVLPRGVRAGHVKINGMRGEGPVESPPSSPKVSPNTSLETPASTTTVPPTAEQDSTSQDGSDFPSTNPNPNLQLDMLSSVLPSAMAPSSGLSYQAEPVENPPAPQAPVLNLNMDELFQRLVETGIVANLSEPKKQEEPEKEKPEIIPVSFDDDKSLKVKQPAVIGLLYNGMQCSSCGLRYATPELTSRYSLHLDWHFRQNRKGKDSQRKAHSRTFYYDLCDWTQYEEVEDLEDRAQSWFETEKQTTEVENAVTEDVPEEADQPSVPTGSATELRCHVCHDEFKQFYNEEMEEWHIKPAVVFDGNNFHPFCLEDHKRAIEKSAEALEALVALEENKELSTETEENNVEGKEVKGEDDVVLEEKEGESEKEKETEETEKDGEEKKEEMKEDVEIEEIKTDQLDEVKSTMEVDDTGAESDPEIEVTEPPPAPAIEQIDLEAEENEGDKSVENEEEPVIEKEKLVESDATKTERESFENIKIKEEPLDEPVITDGTEFNFANVEIKEEPIEVEPEAVPEIIEPTEVDTTHAAVKSSIDGNVELDSAPATIPAAPSKIKINITKPLATNKEPEEQKEQKESSVPEISEVENTSPLTPASIKPYIKSRQLQVFPPVEKGEEMSGLCTIM